MAQRKVTAKQVDVPLDGLSDVTITSPTQGQALVLNSSSVWVNQTLSLESLSNVAITGVTDGQVLAYSAGSNRWVNQAVSGVGPLTVKTVLGPYTPVTGDANGMTLVRINSSLDTTFLVPSDTTLPLPVGSSFIVGQSGAGVVSILPDTGVTVNTPLSLDIGAQHGKVTVIKVGPNVWDVEGNLAQPSTPAPLA